MDNPVPHGPKELSCPFWRRSMARVCHTCPMWMHIKGKNKNTGQEIDRWACSIAQFPMLTIEVANEVRNSIDATNELRKEETARHDEMKKYASANLYRQGRIIDALTPPQMVEQKITPLIEHKD